jgi:hypothetical protein
MPATKTFGLRRVSRYQKSVGLQYARTKKVPYDWNRERQQNYHLLTDEL